MFAEMKDAVTERRIRGVRNVDSRPIVRRIRERSRRRRGARHRDHGDDRRKGVRRQRRISARGRARPVLCRVFRLQPFHPDRDPLRRARRDHAVAATHGNAQAAMIEAKLAVTFLRNLEAEPWRFDYFAVLRHLERMFPDQPRIGDSAARRDEFVRLGQDPFMDFPASNLARVVRSERQAAARYSSSIWACSGRRARCRSRPPKRPITTALAQDDAFPRFLDIFNHRFIQLFFRAWADARPIVQHDRPDADRFVAYIGSAIGVGSDALPESRQRAGRGKAGICRSPGRAGEIAPRGSQAPICGMFSVKAEVEEFVGSRLVIEAAEWTILGKRYNVLGEDALLGRSVFSVQDKIRIRIFHQEPCAIYSLPADRRPVRASGRPGVLLQWRAARLGCRAGDPGRRRRADPAREVRPAGLDDAGWRRTGRRWKPIGATRGFIRPSA